jgi:hypothetical protein
LHSKWIRVGIEGRFLRKGAVKSSGFSNPVPIPENKRSTYRLCEALFDNYALFTLADMRVAPGDTSNSLFRPAAAFCATVRDASGL